VSVVLADTLVAVLAGIIIFPAAFSFGIKPEAGASLVFTTLPMVFQQMTGGYFFCLIFFVLLVIATLTSTISLLEVIVATATEELKLSRTKAAVLGSLVTAVIGLADRPQGAKIRGCAYCGMRENCEYRRGGKFCGG
jgi:NSS family neurotransmitter:Na+ symporter